MVLWKMLTLWIRHCFCPCCSDSCVYCIGLRLILLVYCCFLAFSYPSYVIDIYVHASPVHLCMPYLFTHCFNACQPLFVMWLIVIYMIGLSWHLCFCKYVVQLINMSWDWKLFHSCLQWSPFICYFSWFWGALLAFPILCLHLMFCVKFVPFSACCCVPTVAALYFFLFIADCVLDYSEKWHDYLQVLKRRP